MLDAGSDWIGRRNCARKGTSSRPVRRASLLVIEASHASTDALIEMLGTLGGYARARCKPNHLRRSYHVFSSLNPETQSMVSTICSVYL